MQNKSLVAGILSIISGVFGVLSIGWIFLWLYLFRFMFTGPYSPYGPATPEEVFTILAVFYSVIGVVLALLGIR